MENLIVETYEALYSAFLQNKAFELKLNPTAKKQISNFILLLDKHFGTKSIDLGFVFYFIAYQFYRKKDKAKNSRFGVVMPLNHFIGQKALKEWERKPDNWKYWVDKMLYDYEIFAPIEKPKEKTSQEFLDIAEERLKYYYFKENNLFYMCTEYTTLHKEKSEYCQKCKFKNECKDLKDEILQRCMPRV